ncbi:hypothetical protein GCM10009646_06690 [Streptomyces aureus]
MKAYPEAISRAGAGRAAAVVTLSGAVVPVAGAVVPGVNPVPASTPEEGSAFAGAAGIGSLSLISGPCPRIECSRFALV